MKTAEEWLTTMFNSPETTTHTFKQHIEAIQRDAMAHAAVMIDPESETNDCSSCRRHLKDVQQRILADLAKL